MTDPHARTPGAPTPLDPATRDRLAGVARDRGRLWAGTAALLDGSPAVATCLRSGDLPVLWRSGMALFAGQTPGADRALLVLEAHARAARHRPAGHDARALADLHARVGRPAAGDDARAARAVAALCADEAAAWADDDAAGARAARGAQVPLTTGALERGVWDLGRALAQEDGPVWRALGTLVQTFVAGETGRR